MRRETLAGAWAGGTEYGVNFVLLIKTLCLVLCVTWFPFVIFGGLKGFHIFFCVSSFLFVWSWSFGINEIVERGSSRHISKRIRSKILWRQFPPNLKKNIKKNPPQNFVVIVVPPNLKKNPDLPYYIESVMILQYEYDWQSYVLFSFIVEGWISCLTVRLPDTVDATCC